VTLYDFAARLLFPPMLALWRFRVYGRENVPLDGPLIVACNHASYLDPVALGVACPRPLSYMAKAELFRIPVLGAAIRAVYAYPVERGKASATAGIKRSVEVLRQGRAVGIFPQGTRVREGEGEARAGVALLASLGKAPVVPACVWGSGKAAQLHQVKVAFGPALALPADRKATREEMENFTAEVMAQIVALAENLKVGNSKS